MSFAVKKKDFLSLFAINMKQSEWKIKEKGHKIRDEQSVGLLEEKYGNFVEN